MCGDVYRPVRRPELVSMQASIVAVEPLPFVPAMCTLLNCLCGLPSAARKRFIRARLKLIGLYPMRVIFS